MLNFSEGLRLDFLGFDTPQTLVTPLNEMGVPVTKENFVYTTASGTAIIEFARQGLGLGLFLKSDMGHIDDLIPVLPDKLSFPVPFWLVTHRELHTSRRIRIVYDLLAAQIGLMRK